MAELATERDDEADRDIQSELEQLTDKLQKEQEELKRIKTIKGYSLLRCYKYKCACSSLQCVG